MEGNQVSLTRMMLNIATPSDQGISFSRGEILQGTVQEVKTDGLVVMLLKGRLIEAATEVMVKAGQQLFLMVDDFKDGKTYLKVLSPERMEKVENASLSANLQNIGIPAREDTVVMARKLLQHNLPVTPNNLNEMSKGINLLGGANQRNLEVVAFALSRSLPVNQPILSALLQFTDPESDMGKLLQNLTRSVGELPHQEIPRGDSSASILTGLKNEGELLKYVQLLRPLLDILQMQAGDKPVVTAEKIQGLLQSEKELIRGLILLEDIIKNGDTGSKAPVLAELLSRIEGMEKEISGQRIFNYLSRIPESNFNYYYFSFPVKISNEYRLCQLRVNREAGNKILKDQDNIKFIVSLDTAKMGMVLFHVNWNRNHTLTIQGVAEGEKVANYLNQNVGQLINGLGQLGYSVTNLGVRVARKDEQVDKLKPQMEEMPMRFRPFSIDVTV